MKMMGMISSARYPLLLLAVVATAGSAVAQVAWPAEPLAQATNLTGIEGAGSNDFYTDMSSACWNPETRRLWVCRNGPGGSASKFWAIREDGSGGYEIDTKAGNRGEWTGFGDLEGITVANYSDNLVYLMIEGEDKIEACDVSVYGTNNITRVWSIGAYVPTYSGGMGAEGIAFVPDEFLHAQGFVDQNGNPYTSQNGMGGLMFVAHQAGGRLYAFDLNPTSNSFTFVGAYTTGYSESCDLAFDRSEGLLHIFHGADLNKVEVVTLASTLVGGERRLHQVVMFDSIGAGNMEGFAVVSNDDCAQGHRKAFLTIDGGGASSLFMFTQFPCRLSATYNVDDDGDGVPNCDDLCPETPSGQSVNASGCSCSQLDSDQDGVNNCNDQCPSTPSGQSVNANGCSCNQLDSDQDGVNNCNDQCPNTPSGQSVNASGCSCSQLDSDQDGVNNCNDQCPSTPSGQSVNANGCSCSQLDSDQDGVNNCNDQCPSTPSGQSVNANGCSCSQLDSDQDGVNNCYDQCPNTPSGQSVNANGCSCSQLDSDQDGVNNCYDQCPNTPSGQSVNANGCSCSQLDSDQDGVNNCNDQCPNTPSGQSVNANGCPCNQLDDDQDGVNNCNDRCSSTPSSEDANASGCSCSQLDDDQDGINNCDDQCPESPSGQCVNANGCSCSSVDADDDGVADCDDLCPDTPEEAPVDSAGCSCDQLDDDQDGVSNCFDECPDTPAGDPVNAVGCLTKPQEMTNVVTNTVDYDPSQDPYILIVDDDPSDDELCAQSDADDDGVSDCDDVCPGTNTGNVVDTAGCDCVQRGDCKSETLLTKPVNACGLGFAEALPCILLGLVAARRGRTLRAR